MDCQQEPYQAFPVTLGYCMWVFTVFSFFPCILTIDVIIYRVRCLIILLHVLPNTPSFQVLGQGLRWINTSARHHVAIWCFIHKQRCRRYGVFIHLLQCIPGSLFTLDIHFHHFSLFIEFIYSHIVVAHQP